MSSWKSFSDVVLVLLASFQCCVGKAAVGARIAFPLMFSFSKQIVFAQAPVNDVVSWPPGLLLLATIMYAAIANAPDRLWEIEPTIGFFMANGLPHFSFPGMKKVAWVAAACHFVPGIRTSSGVSNFWIRTNQITAAARTTALKRVLKAMHCIHYSEPRPYNADLWTLTPAGLVIPTKSESKSNSNSNSNTNTKQEDIVDLPSARDFLLFAAIDYHAFRDWQVDVCSHGKVVLSTTGMPHCSAVDVQNIDEARAVVIAQMVRRPNSQSPLRALAHNQGSDSSGPYSISIESVPPKMQICAIDFHSYSPESSKVSGTLQELSEAYYRVVQYIKSRASDIMGPTSSHQMAQIDVGQTLWISILGGVLFEKGRLTIQNLPGRWGLKGTTPDDAYLSRLDALLKLIEPYTMTPDFQQEVVYSNGIARRSAYPFLLAGVFAQAIACYFLTVGTSAGVWTSVALSNSLFIGRLTDLHSLFWGKTIDTEEPGMKMRLPGSASLLAVATFDTSTPRQGGLRPGIILNLVGLIAAILGAKFQLPTREALEFGPFKNTPNWVAYTSITLCLGMSLLIGITIIFQQVKEKTWFDDSEIPTRWMIFTTLLPSCLVSGLALYLVRARRYQFWPILDAITWISGLPLGMLENGRMISVDHNTLHMALLNRWIMGAVASSVGSASLKGASASLARTS